MNKLYLILCFFCMSCNSSRSFVSHALEIKAHENGFHQAPHQILTLENGMDAYLERIALIRSAKRSIDVQYFLFHDDECGKLFGLELFNAAQRGVQVRIIVDQMFIGINLEYTAAVLNTFPNLKIKAYNPISTVIEPNKLDLIGTAIIDFNRLNQRMHNKLICIDGELAICGGRNIGNEYFDWHKGLNFRDRDILISGPVIADLSASFEEYWDHPICVSLRDFSSIQRMIGTKTLPTIADLNVSVLKKQVDARLSSTTFKERHPTGLSTVESVAAWIDPPGKFLNKEQPIQLGHHLAALQMQCTKEFCLQSPYFVLSNRAIYIFEQLKKKGVQLTISTNSLAATDNWPTYAYLHRQKKLMVKNLDMDISEFKPFPIDLNLYIPNYPTLRNTMYSKEPNSERLDRARDPYLCLHAKTMTIDDTYSIIGTYNLDPRSQDYNTEMMIVIQDQTYTKQLKERIKRDAHPDNSWIVAKRHRTLAGNSINGVFSFANDILRNLTTVDIWPLRYTSCYELKSGMSPVRRDHPDFHQHYENVGIFPGISIAESKGILSRLTKTLGGFLHPIL